MRLTMKLAGLAGLMVLAGCEVPPQGTSAEDVARFQAAVASIGCEMVGESDYLPVELQAGLTRQQATDLVSFHLATGKAVELESGGARLVVGDCTPEPAA
ncbi:hypothetical protein [Roseovarius faecimaris]|uniref:hypothetical protein n=1 Tax=Roseovarius faecimaris TaxID=2494550 RepID=UPI001FE67844|nr:hypothetical protein [Roseovarius faecimaris]